MKTIDGKFCAPGVLPPSFPCEHAVFLELDKDATVGFQATVEPPSCAITAHLTPSSTPAIKYLHQAATGGVETGGLQIFTRLGLASSKYRRDVFKVHGYSGTPRMPG